MPTQLTEAWLKRSLKNFAGRKELWDQEHALKRIKAGQRAIDVSLVEKWAAMVSYLGPQPLAGHSYAKGVDLAGPGRDETVHFAVDLKAGPPQLVYARTYPQQDTPTKIRSIENLDEVYPGPLFIDGTMDNAIAALVTARNKTAVRFTAGSRITEDVDKKERLKWLNVPREVILG